MLESSIKALPVRLLESSIELLTIPLLESPIETLPVPLLESPFEALTLQVPLLLAPIVQPLNTPFSFPQFALTPLQMSTIKLMLPDAPNLLTPLCSPFAQTAPLLQIPSVTPLTPSSLPLSLPTLLPIKLNSYPRVNEHSCNRLKICTTKLS